MVPNEELAAGHVLLACDVTYMQWHQRGAGSRSRALASNASPLCSGTNEELAVLATSKSGTHWEPRDQGLDGGLVSSLMDLL